MDEFDRAALLLRQNRPLEARWLLERQPAARPRLLAAALASTGDHHRACALYAELAARTPPSAVASLDYSHALRVTGDRAGSIAACRAAIALDPRFGAAWWGLADFRPSAFTAQDRDQMRAVLSESDLRPTDRWHLHYALGRAEEDAGAHEAGFTHITEGARLRRATLNYDPALLTGTVDRTIALMTEDFFAARAGAGCADPAPIFVLGLPRSGSTLIEQMLACHSQVEGTMELPELVNVARDLCPDARRYPDGLAALSAAEITACGARYLARTRVYRHSAKPRFVDKMPGNWLHAGFIRLILPNATIIEARREPLASRWSMFRQLFARGHHDSYDLTEIARTQADHARLMAHFDAVLPGHIHHVGYEALVDDTGSELRHLLAACNLPFERACLRFFENPRPVRTASSEQVRQPIYRDALGRTAPYAQQLGTTGSEL